MKIGLIPFSVILKPKTLGIFPAALSAVFAMRVGTELRVKL